MRPKVTVYITCHNYSRFVEKAVASVFLQIFENWELIIIDDGSTDDSKEVINNIKYTTDKRVKTIFNEKTKGLPFCANLALKEAKGEYLIRLDADDYFDEAALLTMTTILDKNSEIALVFPNYILIDEDGTYLGVEQRKRLGSESIVHDLPAHGACTMFRKRVIKGIGGYSSDYSAQDGYQIWLELLNRYKFADITTPLFFYRQHNLSMSKNLEKLYKARKMIKSDIAARGKGDVKLRTACIIPAKNTYKDSPNICLEHIAGKPLIDYAVEAALDSKQIGHIQITSDDKKVLDYCLKKFPKVLTNLRPKELSYKQVKLISVMRDATFQLEKEHSIYTDIVAVINIHNPFIEGSDIDEAIDTLRIYDVDSVTSVYEDFDLHFIHGQLGLEPINKGAMNQLRLEREALYVDNNAIKIFWRDVLSGENLFGKTLGHVVMPFNKSWLVGNNENNWIIEELIKKKLNKEKNEKNAVL